jgi:hypothetical protein
LLALTAFISTVTLEDSCYRCITIPSSLHPFA